MAISISPVLPVLAPQEAGQVASDLTLQQGSLVDAQVLKILSADLVRIAIAGLSIDVQTEVPLQAGQNLQLAVSQTNDGVRLQLVGPGDPSGGTSDAVKLSPGIVASLGTAAQGNTTTSGAVLTPLERVTITSAVQSAATVQDSQGPLFANLAAVVSANLPPKLQAAIAQVLAQQTSLDEHLDGDAVKTAFQKSGLLLEASLASGVTPSNGVPDLKAALIVLRQTLQSSLGADNAIKPAVPAMQDAAAPHSAAPGLVPPAAPDLEVQEILLPQARVPVAEDLLPAGTGVASALAHALDTGPSPGGALNLIQEALQELDGHPRQPAAREMPAGDVVIRTTMPPPPIRGSLPAAQAVAQPSIAPDAPLPAVAHRLLGDTDAALARQTLLQVASLPHGVDPRAPVDAMIPRWNFEVPFLTQQGTAMAQFEISRDGGNEAAESTQLVWRARFTLDIEPAGPVHALVSLTGERTSVRMWAERPATAAQLRANAFELSQALARAELTPGEIEIRDGAPQQAAAARAGHFLDRAL
ncbi:flagellar hook-length control protein FliK [Bradyrhizobium jicamae]|uniref:Flagellar hook-length control protein FliK n=1 Tax=Bradyrhizobium jicamae TaxID=280332 RepID=A0ABS5FNZ8_9BRAD|nr:flagellar hook-length control protein FliK [Bradyrhizobium jicamae]MBR0798529.1 flagellar hook-length control protein FliK [Bradyrhizobium jicamae]